MTTAERRGQDRRRVARAADAPSIFPASLPRSVCVQYTKDVHIPVIVTTTDENVSVFDLNDEAAVKDAVR
jgi:hypothetical protein